MSGLFYDKLWYSAQNNAEDLLNLDESIQADQTPKSKHDALKKLLPVYIKYLHNLISGIDTHSHQTISNYMIFRYRNLIQKLAEVYDLMIHSQKRELIKRLFDCSVGRMLEYKREIVKLTCTDYQ